MIQEQGVTQQIKPRSPADEPVSLANILVATDFSQTSDRALEHALVSGANLQFSNLSHPRHSRGPNDGSGACGSLAREDAQSRQQRNATDGNVGTLFRSAPRRNHRRRSSLADYRSPDQATPDRSPCGRHTWNGVVQKLLIGSSAEQIFRQARIPVLTVGPGVRRQPLYGIELKNILFATAFGVGAERQAAYAFSLAQEHRSRISLLHVKQRPDEEQMIVHQLRELVPSGPDLHCLPLFRVERGDPVKEILRVAEQTRADLIVLGAKSRKGLAGHVPHTKAYQVICGASCPVLTIKS